VNAANERERRELIGKPWISGREGKVSEQSIEYGTASLQQYLSVTRRRGCACLTAF
jgi:hypothetical protein